MMRLILTLLLSIAGLAKADVTLSDFASLSTLPYVTADPGPWSDQTAAFSSTTATIADFGNGIPSGQAGNGFIYFFAITQDWSATTSVTLTGTTLASNAARRLNFYIEDQDGNASVSTRFTLAGFSPGNVSFTLPISYGAVDRTQVAYWGFVTSENDAPQFGFTFDRAAVDTVPEPASAGLLTVGIISSLFLFRKKIRHS